MCWYETQQGPYQPDRAGLSEVYWKPAVDWLLWVVWGDNMLCGMYMYHSVPCLLPAILLCQGVLPFTQSADQ